jgi:hypothetical protein
LIIFFQHIGALSSSNIHETSKDETTGDDTVDFKHDERERPSFIGPSAAGEKPQQKMQQQCSKDEFGREQRMSSPNISLGPTSTTTATLDRQHHSGANSCELASLRTTDSFPRVFKEFDFLEVINS